MGRSKRRKRHEPPAPLADPNAHVEPMGHHPFASALKGVRAAPKAPEESRRPKPPEPAPRAPAREAEPPRGAAGPRYAYDDRMALREALAGVRPLGEPQGREPARRRAPKPRVEPPKRVEADEETRRRLDALVSGAVRFEIRRGPEGEVSGRRQGAHASHLAALGEGFAPQASLDLHGLRAEAAARAVVRFVRDAHASGKKNVLIIHGRGNGSLRGLAVLKDVVVDALTESGASRLVLAFSSAPRRLGGVGALAVRLGER